MAQISLPFRIVLIAVALLGAVWFVALRPKADPAADAPLPAAPGVTGLTSSAAKAESAAKAATASAERSEAAAKAAEAGSSAPSAAKAQQAQPAATAASKPAAAKEQKTSAARNSAAPLLAALDRGQVVVLLFRNGSDDSAAVAGMVRSIGERSKVVARVAPIRDVGRYQTFTGTTQVSQAPTTMVIGPRRNAKLIVGFTSTGEIAQAVADVRRSGKKT
jgi:hypothetical protein